METENVFNDNDEIQFDENKIHQTINHLFNQQSQQNENIHNQITDIHPQIHFKYNSLNICLGKQGSGKTTFMLTELIKLSSLKQCVYDRIVYITNGEVDDITFKTLKTLIQIPIYGLNFNDATRELSSYFTNRKDNQHHIFIIVEDASFLLLKDNPIWVDWVCKLRHLRCTIWINLHVWRSISTMIKTQITTLFIFKGYSKEQLQQMYRQSSSNTDFKTMFCWYSLLEKREVLKISNIDGKISIINKNISK